MISLDGAATINAGTQNLNVQPADMVVLDVSATEQDAVPNTVATGALLLDGSNVGLDDGVANENLVSMAIIDWANLSPLIKSHPTNREPAVGGTASFTAAVNGGLPMAYQWNRNGVPINGATNLTLTITNVQSSQAGNYTLVATNRGGLATSLSATLTVNAPPNITTQPQSQTKTAGEEVTFQVVATGTGPLVYQWKKNGAPLAGATNSYFTLAPVQSAHAGNYTVAVTNFLGGVSSGVATLTVVVPASTLSVSDSGLTGAGFNFLATVPQGATYVVEISTDLQSWSPIATNVADSATITFTDPEAGAFRTRFYRLVVK